MTSLDHPWISKRFVGIFARRNAGTDGHRTFSSSEWQNVDGYRDAEEAGPDIKKKVLRAGCLAQLRPPRRGQQIACFRASLHHSVTLLTLAGNPSAYLVSKLSREESRGALQRTLTVDPMMYTN
ncbi:uncharacterized protein LOC105662151 isoform X4 [Megachile rotundata]|uniref:uncharacterized protein LOC105662151 isoform X4 n=1 Tax=Megachile rotundata TaxID=143995 RepID=UPI003FD131FC